MACTNFIIDGINRDCELDNSQIGVDKDLILIDYKYFDLALTKLKINRESNNNNNNYKGLSNIVLKDGAVLNVFEGVDYSVIPSIIPQPREDGSMRYQHSINFTVYSKNSKDREILTNLSKVKVIAVAKDISTGLYELFGMEQGLRLSGIERSYVGSINSNYYSVTIATPDYYVVKESNIGELSVTINGAIVPPPTNPPIEALTEQITDYNYSILRDPGPTTLSLYLSRDYIPLSTKVHINGVRITRGFDYDYQEISSNIITMNYPIALESLITVDYKALIII
jgi:hypothetical protein